MIDDDDRILQELKRDWDAATASLPAWEPDPDVKEATLRRILRTTPSARRRWRLPGGRRMTPVRLGAVTAIAAVVVTVLGVISGWPSASRPAYAATPDPLHFQLPREAISATALLTRIAAAADRSTGGSGTAPVEYLRTESWELSTIIDEEQVTSAVVPTEQRSWRTLSDSGVVVRRYLPPVFASEQDRKHWEAAGSPGVGTAPTRETSGPQAFPALWRSRPPTDPVALRTWLGRQHQGGTPATAMYVAVVDLLKERVLTGPERAAVLRLLADLPGIEYTGTVTDRAGRSGDAFSIISTRAGPPTRETLIIDRTTGRFLACEQMLTTEAGQLNVQIPAVIRYSTFLDAQRVSEVP